MPRDALFNAVYNNWHSWGLIVKDAKGKMMVTKEVPENGENDPEKIFKLLNDNVDCQRILHLRFATKGAVNEQNAQPFQVYNSSKRQVWFMHNGTLGSFGPAYSANPPPDQVSDSFDYAEKQLSKALLHWTGENGKADYTDEAFYETVIKHSWTQQSKGILISNDLQDIFWGPTGGWQVFKQEGDDLPEILVSNDDYFKSVTRGPESDRRKKKLEEQRTASGQSEIPFANRQHGGTGGIIDKATFLRSTLAKDPKVIQLLTTIWNDINLYEFKDAADFGHVTTEEWAAYVEKEEPACIALLLEIMATHMYDARAEIMKLENDLVRKHAKIGELMEARRDKAA